LLEIAIEGRHAQPRVPVNSKLSSGGGNRRLREAFSHFDNETDVMYIDGGYAATITKSKKFAPSAGYAQHRFEELRWRSVLPEARGRARGADDQAERFVAAQPASENLRDVQEAGGSVSESLQRWLQAAAEK
jgi:hypothetical protein